MTDCEEIQEAIKAAARAYKREWTRKNKERVKEYKQRYWLKKAIEQGLIDPETVQNNGQFQKGTTKR